MTIAIVGGGAAGMMAAATLVEEYPGTEVILFEKNASLGKKVIISGGGRCNVTTGIDDIRQVLKKYPRGTNFLRSAMTQFSPTMVYSWFEAHGVPLKCEADMRVFPKSNNGKDIVGVFESLFRNSKIEVRYKHNVIDITKTDTQFIIRCKDQGDIIADKVIIALGGQAYRHTGSTGDGYAILERFGHTITPLAASLNSFFTREAWPKSLSGLSFEKATIFVRGQKKQYAATGPFLFTHTGLSGPAVFALSSHIAFFDYTKATPLEIGIDLFPDMLEQELIDVLKHIRENNLQKAVKNTLSLIPKSLAEHVCTNLHFPIEKKNVELSKKDIATLAQYLKDIPLSIIGRGAGDEFVTAGGVELSEVDPKTMESRICPGLYFAGEILNIDGYTGGFNLQASWATGSAAGLAAGVK